MARLEILEYPDERLRLHAQAVTVFDDNLAQLIDDLLETLHGSQAIGLCAPQANDQRQVLVMDLSGNASAPQVYVNPEILSRSRLGIVQESCLSVPGVVVNVVRATHVCVRAQDRRGETFGRVLEGMDAVCLQHEMDHFKGKLLADRLWFFRRRRVRAAAMRSRRHRGSPNVPEVPSLAAASVLSRSDPDA